MRHTPEKLKELYKLLQNKVHLKSIVMTLAVLVVFVTTYVLILPAFTLDKEEAAEQGGINVVAVEQQVEAEADEATAPVEQQADEATAPVEQQADEATAPVEQQNEDAKAEETEKAEAKEEAVESKDTDTAKAETKKAESTDEKANSKDDKAEVELLTDRTDLTAEGKDFTVITTVDANAKVPADTSLAVKELKENTPDFDYDKYYNEALEALQKDGSDVKDIKMIRFYDISLESDTQDDSVEPSDKVSVKIAYDKGIKVSDANNIRIVHFGEEKTEVLDTKENKVETEVNTENQLTEASFETDGFSVYAVVEGSTDDNARMTVEFYSNGTLVETMYVKNSDTLEELELILHDPGTSALGEGEVFNGWILDKPNYTTADVGGAWNIGQVREWAAAEEITEGDAHRLDAAICKLYIITYKDLDGTVLGKDAIPVKSSEYGAAQVDYVVNMGYTPHDDVHNFEGWTVDEDTQANVTTTPPADGIYSNDTQISIKGDVSFTVNAPEGNWLIFDENGKGGKYNAPQFVKSGEVTKKPCDDEDMTRKGYTFGGWYDTKEHADAHGDTGKVTFGDELSAKTTIYASWIPKEKAPYTVVFWGQKLNSDGTGVLEGKYDVLGSYVNEEGTVGNYIPYSAEENGDEDFANVTGTDQGHYTGFCLTEASKNQQITITPEGDAVLNLYYDRIKYNFKFYLYRDGTTNNRYDYANNSDNGRDLNGVVTWRSNQTQHPSVNGRTIHSETVDGRTYYYFVLDAYYGENISSKWPKYDEITGANGHDAVSFVMMVGTALKPNPTSTGSGTVKGVITVMNENILGATNDANGNYVVIRFPDSYYNWRYHIWFETIDGEDYSGKTTHTWNGKTYYEETVLTVRSSNTTVTNQNAPKYEGFDFIDWRGEAWNNRNYWTSGGNPTLYHINEVYSRQQFKITYFDGNYVDGSGNQIQNRAENKLHESPDIPQGKVIAQEYRNYEPTPPEAGYVFAGWYIDEGCTVEYTWDKMPVGGIVVHAKWVQKQYRVFLHPNAGRDESLDWGSESVSTSFRVGYGGKISTPTGKREESGYEFVGWYTDPSCESQYLYKPDTLLNETTVTTPYNQTEATELDKWGDPLVDADGNYIDDEGNILVDGEGNPNWNKDKINDRYWITGQVNLYAKWRKILEGSDGINVVYTADDGKGHVGTNPPHDEALYPDQAEATAQSACNAPENWYFKCWVVQKWDSEQNIFVDTDITVWPGQKFTVKEGDAHKEPVEGETDKFTYTIQLRAEYAEPESHLPTHIWWFNNYADDGAERHYAAHQNEGIKINEAVNILEAPTREGYEFLGWARIPTGVSQSLPGEDGARPTGKVLDLDEEDLYLKYEGGAYKLNDTTSQYNGTVVTQIAADERLQYHDLYAVWKVKTYDVDIEKIVNGVTETKKFKINYSYGSESGSVNLGNGQSTSDVSIGKTISVPYGTLITVTEDPDDEYEASYSATHKVTVKDDNGNESIEDQSFNAEESGAFRITSDTLITVTNTRKAQNVRIYKIDQASAEQTTKVPLKGAEFTLNGQKYTTNDDGYTDAVELYVSNEPYTLEETKAPDGYNLPENPSYITVKGDKVEYKQGSVGETVEASYDPITRVYTVTITNTAGKPLPHTGGIGTTIFYILGSMLVIGCGIVLVSRKRMGANK